MKKVFCVFALGLLFLSYDIATACICTRIPTATEALKSAEVVFAGKVVAISNGLARFKVEQSWKGVSTAEVGVLTGSRVVRRGKRYTEITTWTTCDVEFEKGESYLVFAVYSDRFLRSQWCSRTQRLASAEEAMKELGEGKPLVRKHFRILRKRPRST